MKIYFISFLLFLFPQIVFSNLIQDMDRFNHLTVQDGLASQYVIDIHQDQKGFIWLCTSNGLARYDGHRFKVYRNEPDNPNSLSHSTVNSIVETKEGVFWVATINGLNRLDPRTETIQRFLVDKRQHRIPKIILSDADILWVATRYQGLICFNTKTFDYHYIQHDPNKPHTLSSNTIQTLYIDHLNYLWIGTIKGLDRYDPTTQTFLNYKGDPNDKNSLFSSPVTAIHEDSDGTLWVGTDGRIQQFNRQFNQFKTIYPDQQHSQVNVRFIDSDRQHHIWVGSSHDGVWMFDRNPSQWKHFTHDNTPYSLSENSLLCFLQDRSGTYWFGFTGKGISLLYPKHKKIGWLTHKPDDINSIAGDAITGMIEDHQGKIWLSINGFGLDCLDLATNKIVHYKANKDHPEQLISPTVVSLLEDHQHQIWVGTWGAGLECLNPKTGIFTHYQHDPNNPDSISANLITDIYEDDLHTLWIATWGGGLNRWDFKTQHFQHYRNDPDNPDSIRDNRIIDIYEDSHKTLWLALIGGGAARFDRATEKFIHFSHDNDLLSKTTIHCFYEDQHRHFWLGTISRGLLRLDRETEAVQCYSTQEGLPSNLVSGILEDDTGNLWISTDNGLACLNPTTEKIVNYDRHDGLTSPYFFMRSALKRKNGQFYLGGNKGVNIFYPSDMKKNPFVPPIVFTDFQLFNQPVDIGSGALLKRSITYVDHLSLTHEQTVFTLTFAALNYISSQKNRYAYYMSTVDKDWVYVDSSRPFATYTKLPPGNYTFNVKGSNNDGVWNEEGVSLNINILAPWWQRLWFKTASFLGIFLIVMLFYQMRLIRMKKSKQRLECQVMARTRELQVSNQKLTEEMDRFSKVMSSLDLSIYVADINTYELLFVNKKIQDAFGDVEGKICWQSLQHGQTGPCPFCTNDKLLDDNGKPNPIYVWKFQNTITKKWYYIQNSAIKWRDGRWVRLEIATDITDIIHAEKELKEAKEKAESASRAKTLFLANMSHELRTPLNSILGFSQLVLQNPQDLSEHKDYLHAIHKSGEHLHQLISDILDIAKIEENYETLNERATDLRALISDIQKVMQVPIHNKDLTLHCHIENDLPVIVTIDNLKLSQVLINLINNAIKFTDKGDISLRLKSTPSSNHWVQLHFEIEDTGRGISEQDPNILFDTFQQSSESNPGEYEGIGLGLSICKKYIQMMGGTIWAKNNDKKGATFIFDIPAKRVETSGNKLNKYKKNQTIHFKADRAYNVLIADDHENNRRFLSEALKPVGIEIFEARNGQEAIHIWNNHPLDLIWLDIAMPIMNGYEVVKHIRQAEAASNEHVVIIAMTASAFREDRATILDAGCDDYLLKPYMLSSMFEMLAKHLKMDYSSDDGLDEINTEIASKELRSVLKHLSEKERADLKESIEMLDYNATTTFINKIEKSYPHIAAVLMEKANQFDFEGLEKVFFS